MEITNLKHFIPPDLYIYAYLSIYLSICFYIIVFIIINTTTTNNKLKRCSLKCFCNSRKPEASQISIIGDWMNELCLQWNTRQSNRFLRADLKKHVEKL